MLRPAGEWRESFSGQIGAVELRTLACGEKPRIPGIPAAAASPVGPLGVSGEKGIQGTKAQGLLACALEVVVMWGGGGRLGRLISPTSALNVKVRLLGSLLSSENRSRRRRKWRFHF